MIELGRGIYAVYFYCFLMAFTIIIHPNLPALACQQAWNRA